MWGGYMVWGLGGVCMDVAGVHGVYVMYACVQGMYICVQGVHACEGCTWIQMGAFAGCICVWGTLMYAQHVWGVHVWGGLCMSVGHVQACAQRPGGGTV